MKLISFICSYILGCCLYVSAQQFQPHAIQYTVDHGIPSSECYGVIQDSKGVIWIGTDKGICRFDGLRFSRLTTANGLPENVVFDFFEDHRKRIWCRTFSKGVFYIENDRVRIPSFNKSLQDFLGQNLLNNLYVGENDSVYMESSSTFICSRIGAEDIKVNRGDKRVIRFINGFGFPYGRDRDSSRSVTLLFNDSSFSSEIRMSNLDMLFRSAILHNGDILFNIFSSLFIKRQGTQQVKLIRQFDERIISMCQDRDGGIWLGMVNGGVYYFAKDVEQEPRHYFTNESVSDIMQDAEGNIWLTTLKSGVYFVPNKDVLSIGSSREPFSLIKKVGNEYIGAAKNGYLYFFDDRSVKSRASYNTPIYKYNLIYDIADYDRHNLLLLGVSCSFMNKKHKTYSGMFFPRFFLRGARGDHSNGDRYVFAYSYICKVNFTTGLASDTFRYTGSRITDVVVHGDSMWASTLSGLLSVDFAAGTSRYTGGGLLRSRINVLKFVSGKLILGTDDDGILVYDTRTHKVKKIAEKEGMSSNCCQNILLDGHTIWVATNKGISVIDMDSGFDSVKRIRTIDKHDGLPGVEINSIEMDSADVWVASNAGITRFSKHLISENPYAPLVYFDYARTNRQYYKDIGIIHEFQPEEHFVEMSFYAVSYKSLRKIRYKYRLAGADDEWHYTYQTRVTYPSLPPGDYTFELYAINNDGVENTEPLRFSFRIRSPFYSTWWFLSGCAILLAGIVALGFNYRLGILRKRENERNFYDNKMLEFEMRALKAQMNPHFIFNAIASIQHFIISNDLRSANKYLVKFSRLIRGVLDHSHSSLVPLRKELDTLRLYIDIENLRFSNKIEYTFVIDNSVDLDGYSIPPLLFQPFVENAIWHGLLPKTENCRLDVRLTAAGGKIVCEISDNGVGRAFAAHNPAKRGKRRSLGVEMTQNRILALEKIYHVSLGVEYIDKTFNGAPAGTTVVITLPIINEQSS
jgi:hypothetical protein